MAIVLIAGMGFYTDAYDLFIIGVVLKLLNTEWPSRPWRRRWSAPPHSSLLRSVPPSSAGSRTFSGASTLYGFEVLVLGFGAVALRLA